MAGLTVLPPSHISLAAAGLGSVVGADIDIGARGCQVWVYIPAGNTGTSPTVQVLVEGKDPMTGAYYTLLDSGALAAGGALTKLLTLYPGLTAIANQVVTGVLPQIWRVRAVVGGTTPVVTATVGVSGVL